MDNSSMGLLDMSLTITNSTTTAGNWTNVDGNLTNEDSDESNRFAMPWWQQLLWSSAFGGMVLVATGGNAIVIWIVLAHKRMRTVTNYFLVNLSVADAMVSTLNVIFSFTFMLNGDWPFGDVYCKVNNFVAIVSVAASVFTMMAISVDRYMAIMSPLSPRMSKVATINMILMIWICASALSLPNILFSTTFARHYRDGTHRTICFHQWPDGMSSQSQIEHTYNIIIVVTTYLLPIGAMMIAYWRVGRELWGSQSIGECTAKQMDSVRSKRRVVKMMIVVVIIFAVCWLPYHIYFLMVFYASDVVESDYVQHLYLAMYWLAMSNSMYNPFIYCWMNARFRKGFKRVFQWCPFKVCSEHGIQERHEHANARYSCSRSPEMMSRLDRDGTVHVPLHTLTEAVSEAHGNTDNSALIKSVHPASMLKRFCKERPSHV